MDLTDIVRAEGIDEQINAPSFAPWTSRGRIFGLPHDVHPVLLAYRADLVEAAGIDVAAIETWDDFVRLLRPLVRDVDGDGYPDHYLLNIWETNPELIESLMLQAGGALFDAQERLVMHSESNARVLATVVSWTTGPNRIAVNAPEFDAAGNKMRLDGTVLFSLMPDWLTVPGGKTCRNWREGEAHAVARLGAGGPAHHRHGGDHAGDPQAVRDFDSAWRYAKYLYLSPDLARALFRTTGIISPVKRHWTDPVYDEPSPYFSGQPMVSSTLPQRQMCRRARPRPTTRWHRSKWRIARWRSRPMPCNTAGIRWQSSCRRPDGCWPRPRPRCVRRCNATSFWHKETQ